MEERTSSDDGQGTKAQDERDKYVCYYTCTYNTCGIDVHV